MNTKILLSWCVLLVLGHSSSCSAKQISELKCEETFQLRPNAQSFYPHLMEIVKVESDNGIVSMCYGTLISENFVLTSAYCTRYALYTLSEGRVRKLKLPGETYSNHQLYRIKRYIPHELYDDTLGIYNDMGLVQLDEMIPYNNIGSVFRPACLWTNSLLRTSYKYSVYGHELYENADGGWDSRMLIKPAKLISNDRCDNLFEHTPSMPDGVIHSNICVNSSDVRDTEFFAEKGSPIQAKVGNRHYIFGIVSRSFDNEYYTLSLGTKVSRFIAWIQGIVWPRHTNVISPVGCGERKIKHKPLITYGQPTYHGEFPWHVGLYRLEGATKPNRKYICGGTIISNSTILTAAHCIKDDSGTLAANRLLVVAGKYNLNENPIDARIYNVDLIIPHAEYNREYLENDIALLKLSTPIVFSNYIQPICVSDNSDYNSITLGTVAGWGRDEHNEQSDILLQAVLPIRINSECRDSNRDFFPNYLNDFNYCAGYENGTSVCSGDSGGGMIFEHESRWYIRGIVSLGMAIPNSDRCDVTQMVLFSDVPKFYDWIAEYFESN